MRLTTSAALLSLLGSSACGADAFTRLYQPGFRPNRVSLGGFLLLNAKVSFRNTLASPATAPDPGPATGAAEHFYDDGYNRVDGSGNMFPPGATSFWGYQNPGQLVDDPNDPTVGTDSVAMHATTIPSSSRTGEETADPGWGVELSYGRVLGHSPRWYWGVEGALGYLNLNVDAGSAAASGVNRVTDLYSLTVNGVLVSPPSAPYAGPYVPSVGSPLLSDSPGRTSATLPATISGRNELDANLFSLRLGPFVDYAVTERFSVGAGAGLALIYVDSRFEYSNTFAYDPGTGATTLRQSGRDDDSGTVVGGYVGARVRYDFTDRLGLFASGSYLGAGDFKHSTASQKATIDLAQSFLVSVGLSIAF